MGGGWGGGESRVGTGVQQLCSHGARVQGDAAGQLERVSEWPPCHSEALDYRDVADDLLEVVCAH